MLLKNLNNDTCLSDVPLDGWVEISSEELDAIRESRTVVPPAPTPPTAIEQIRALEQQHMDDQRKLNRQAAIDTALTVACRSPAADGKTRDEVHAIYYSTNRGYRAMVDLEAQIAELRKLL